MGSVPWLINVECRLNFGSCVRGDLHLVCKGTRNCDTLKESGSPHSPASGAKVTPDTPSQGPNLCCCRVGPGNFTPGNFTPSPHRSLSEPLDSHGSCHRTRAAALH